MQDVVHQFCKDWGIEALYAIDLQHPPTLKVFYQIQDFIRERETLLHHSRGLDLQHETLTPLNGKWLPGSPNGHNWFGLRLGVNHDHTQVYQVILRFSEPQPGPLHQNAQKGFLAALRLLFLLERRPFSSLSFLDTFTREISSRLELDEILQLLYDYVGRLVKTDAFLAGFLLPDGESLDLTFIMDEGRRYPRIIEPIGDGILSQAIQQKKPVYFRRTREEVEYLERNKPANAFGNRERISKSLLAFPILQFGKPIGIVSVQSYEFDAFQEDDIELLNAMIQQASTAIVNALHYHEQQKRATFFALVDAIHRTLWDIRHHRQFIRDFLALFSHHFPDSRFAFFWQLKDGQEWEGFALQDDSLHEETIQHLPDRQPLLKRLFDTHKSVICSQLRADDWLAAYLGNRVQSVILCPLIIDQRIKGVLAIGRSHAMAFSDQDAKRFELLLSRISIAFAKQEFMEKLAEERDRLTAILDHLQIGVHILDQNYKILFANKWTEEHLSQKQDAEKCYEAFFNRTTPCEACPLAKGKEGLNDETLEVEMDNQRVYKFFLTEFRNVSGERQILEIIMDKTQDRRLEEEKAKVEVLETVMAMAGTIAHELNQPLTGITGLISLILEETEPGDEMYETFKEIENQAIRIRELVRKFQNITRVEKMRYLGKEIVDLRRSTN